MSASHASTIIMQSLRASLRTDAPMTYGEFLRKSGLIPSHNAFLWWLMDCDREQTERAENSLCDDTMRKAVQRAEADVG